MPSAIFHILLLLLAYSAIGQSNGDTLYVAAHSGLNLRTAPGTKAPKLTVIPKGGQVVVLADVDSSLAHSVTEFPGFDIKGFWEEVDYSGQVGFVFSGYLSGFKPFDKIHDRELQNYHMEVPFYYLWRNFKLHTTIDYYNQNHFVDSCHSDWSTPFAENIVYRAENDCSSFMGYHYVEFENYSLQEVYLFYLLSRKYPCKPIWNKETKGITVDEYNENDVIWSEDRLYPQGNKIIWVSTGGC